MVCYKNIIKTVITCFIVDHNLLATHIGAQLSKLAEKQHLRTQQCLRFESDVFFRML